MKQFEYQVEAVKGYCSCGYRVGDIFRCKGMNTPDAQFCGGAYTILFPIQVALFNGARFDFEDDPKSKGNLACPDKGCVIFRIVMIEE